MSIRPTMLAVSNQRNTTDLHPERTTSSLITALISPLNFIRLKTLMGHRHSTH